jgi:hypothetical protein
LTPVAFWKTEKAVWAKSRGAFFLALVLRFAFGMWELCHTSIVCEIPKSKLTHYRQGQK